MSVISLKNINVLSSNVCYFLPEVCYMNIDCLSITCSNYDNIEIAALLF